MPFIDCKITEKLTEEKKEEIKRKFGQAVTRSEERRVGKEC